MFERAKGKFAHRALAHLGKHRISHLAKHNHHDAPNAISHNHKERHTEQSHFNTLAGRQ